MCRGRNTAASIFIIGLLIAGPSMADTLTITLDFSSLLGSPSSSVMFTGTVQNNSGAEVFLNGAGGNLSYPELTLDLTPFFTFTPPSIPDGQSYDGPLFAVAISGVALPGDYPGNTFSIQGGLDSSTFDTVGTTEFEVSIPNAASVPEPSSGTLLGSMAALLLCLAKYQGYRRKRTALAISKDKLAYLIGWIERPTLGFTATNSR